MSIIINRSKLIKNFESYSDPKLVPKYIVVHDAASKASALEQANRLQTKDQYDNGVAHLYIDENECYQLIECNVKAYHAGDGVNGKGNGQSLSIEVCRSLPSGGFTSETEKATYKKALDNAYRLVADLCKKYSISSNNILQHKDLSATACPYTQKVLFGSYEKALSNAKSKIGGYMSAQQKYYFKVNAASNYEDMKNYNVPKLRNSGSYILICENDTSFFSKPNLASGTNSLIKKGDLIISISNLAGLETVKSFEKDGYTYLWHKVTEVYPRFIYGDEKVEYTVMYVAYKRYK